MRHSLPEAFSTRWNQRVTIAQVEQRVGESDDFDHRAFRCLGANCGAQVTLANWFTPETERKQARHFRSFHHAAACEYLVYLRAGEHGHEGDQTSQLPAWHLPDRFDPANDNETEKYNLLSSTRAADSRTPQFGVVSRPEDKPLRCTHLGQLIRRFRGLSEKGEIVGRTVLVSEKIVEYEDLFQLVNGQEAQDQQGVPRIWFGLATIKKVSKGYRIVFEGVLRWGKVAFPPAFFVPEEWVGWYPSYSQQILDLFHESASHPTRVNVFAMGDLKEKRSNEKVFLNIKAYKRSEFWIEKP